MSTFGGKADIIQGVAECPLIAISGHYRRGSLSFFKNELGLLAMFASVATGFPLKEPFQSAKCIVTIILQSPGVRRILKLF